LVSGVYLAGRVHILQSGIQLPVAHPLTNLLKCGFW